MSRLGALAVTRFGLGAQPGEIDLAKDAPEQWLLSQLGTSAGVQFPDQALISSKVQFSKALDYFQARRSQSANESTQRAFRRDVRQTTLAEVSARTTFAASTRAPFHERLVGFWANHFTVAANSPQTRVLVGAYEREAIRPHILGSFAELAERAIFHPGMLVYLSNCRGKSPRRSFGISNALHSLIFCAKRSAITNSTVGFTPIPR